MDYIDVQRCLSTAVVKNVFIDTPISGSTCSGNVLFVPIVQGVRAFRHHLSHDSIHPLLEMMKCIVRKNLNG